MAREQCAKCRLVKNGVQLHCGKKMCKQCRDYHDGCVNLNLVARWDTVIVERKYPVVPGTHIVNDTGLPYETSQPSGDMPEQTGTSTQDTLQHGDTDSEQTIPMKTWSVNTPVTHIIDPTEPLHCLDNGCQLDRKDAMEEMIQCSFCFNWYHYVCVGVEEGKDAFTIWPCPRCRTVSRKLEQLSDQMESMERRNITRDQNMERRNITRDQKMDKLIEENTLLRQKVSELTIKLNENIWARLTQPSTTPTDNGKCVVIGSSILRDIDDTQLENTTVICISGGVIDDVKRAVSNIKDKHSHVTLVVGGNDCDSDSDNAEDIVKRYKELIVVAKTKATNVTVSSVCPRINPDKSTLSDKIDSVNAGLQVLCQDESVAFVDNSPSFHLSDGAINDGYLLTDGVHLTRSATDKLIKNIGLQLKDGVRSAHKNKKQHRYQQQRNIQQNIDVHDHHAQPPQTVESRQDDQQDDELSHPFWTNARQKAARPSQRHQTSNRNNMSSQRSTSNYTDSRVSSYRTNNYSTRQNNSSQYSENTYDAYENRCYNCFERNHVVKNCKFDKPVNCYKCNMTGHKAKHHNDY